MVETWRGQKVLVGSVDRVGLVICVYYLCSMIPFLFFCLFVFLSLLIRLPVFHCFVSFSCVALFFVFYLVFSKLVFNSGSRSYPPVLFFDTNSPIAALFFGELRVHSG